MQRISSLFAAAAVAGSLALAGCFGDNAGGSSTGSNGDGSNDPGAPSILEIAAPDAADIGDVLDLTVKVKGMANEQLSVAIDGALGTFSPQNKVVVVDDNGDGTFATRYTGSSAGSEVVTASVANLAGKTHSKVKDLTLYDVERVGNVTPINATKSEEPNYLIAYPFDISGTRTIRRLAIVAPQAATALVGLYNSDSTPKPKDPLAQLTATLTVGANELTIPTQTLSAGRYWMVVCYSGTPLVRKRSDAGAPIVDGYRIQEHMFGAGFPTTMSNATKSTLIERNFYLVLRK